MAILDSNGLKTLAAQIAETYATKDDVSELNTKIAACATKDDRRHQRHDNNSSAVRRRKILETSRRSFGT
ncbi:MAG: hypothetical protein IKP64_10365 [Selenomonadaceae bacterium]|nr:hypothetical protein [Selenomonadaceae bacterium]